MKRKSLLLILRFMEHNIYVIKKELKKDLRKLKNKINEIL